MKFEGVAPVGKLDAVCKFEAGTMDATASDINKRMDRHKVCRNIKKKHRDACVSPENEMVRDFDGFVFKYDPKAGAQTRLWKFCKVDGRYYGKVEK